MNGRGGGYGEEERERSSHRAEKSPRLQGGTGDFPSDAFTGKGIILRIGGNHVVFLELRRDSRVTTGDYRLPLRFGLRRLIDHRCMGLFLGILSCPIDLYFYFYVSTILF